MVIDTRIKIKGNKSQFNIYTDDTIIYFCLNGKSDRFDKVKFAANLKAVVNWGKK